MIKKIVVCLFIVSVIASTVPSVSADDNQLTLSFDYPSEVTVGDTFDLDILLDTNGNIVDVWVIYDIFFTNSLVSVVSSSVGDMWTNLSGGFSGCFWYDGEINNNNGTIRNAQSFCTKPFNGSSVLLEIEMFAKKAGTCNIDFGEMCIGFEGDCFDLVETGSIIITINSNGDNDDGPPITEVEKPPVAVIIKDKSEVFLEENVSFQSESYDDDGEVVNWTWDFGDGTVSYKEDVIHRYNNVGDFTITLFVRDDDGLLALDTDTITVYTLPEDNTTNNETNGNTTNPNDNNTNGNTTNDVPVNENNNLYAFFGVMIMIGAVVLFFTLRHYGVI